jgi:phosphate transport system permease protein
MIPMERWLDQHLGFIPLFDSRNNTFGKSVFAASVVLAIMVLPIVAAICREIFKQVPTVHREAALALGATRWEMIRTAVLPPSRPGIIAGVMLGLGRALGETIAVALVLGAIYDINMHILEPGGNTIAANIALKFGEAASTGRAALVASGLILFAITLVVNVSARAIVRRGALERDV